MRFTRFLYSDNSIIQDWSQSLTRYQSGEKTFSFTAAEDYFYIGNIAPFNHFFLKLSTPSVASSNMKVEYRSTSGWERCIELFDETEGLTQDGFVTFVPNKNTGWDRLDLKYDVDGNVEFSNNRNTPDANDTVIYDKYWVRISFDTDLTASTILSWIGQKFSDDYDLGSEFPDLLRSTVLTAFQSGKTNWEEQHVRAAEIIVRDLIAQQVIFSKGQILERQSFTLSSVSKVSEIIYNSFGDDYLDQKKSAMDEYTKRLQKSIFDVDLNGDAELSLGEMNSRQGFMNR